MHIQDLLACCVVATAGCAADETGIRLHIDTDLDVPSELASVHILIEPAGGDRGDPGLGLDRTVVPGVDAELPIVIGIVPKDGDAGRRVRIVVTPEPGPSLTVPIVAFEHVVRFDEERVVDVFASFPASCEVRDVPGCEEPCLGDDGCDDGIACTIDRCEADGCVHEPDDALCAEGRCDPSSGCAGCDPATCVAGPCETAACIDDRCVVETTCAAEQACCAGACVPVGCDDGDPCTRDFCDDEAGCTNEPASEDESGRPIEECPAT